MDLETIRLATQLRLPSELIAGLSASATLGGVWDACEDPGWVLALARLRGVSVGRIVAIVAQSIPPWEAPRCDDEAILIADALMRGLLSCLQRETPPPDPEGIRSFTKDLLPDWNHAHQRGALPIELSAVLVAYNAVSKAHRQLHDHERWPWPGRLELVGQHCVRELTVRGHLESDDARRRLAGEWKRRLGAQ
jgi:hypothetical protein